MTNIIFKPFLRKKNCTKKPTQTGIQSLMQKGAILLTLLFPQFNPIYTISEGVREQNKLLLILSPPKIQHYLLGLL